MTNIQLIDDVGRRRLSLDEWVRLISSYSEGDREYAAKRAREISRSVFKNKIYVRGIIEFSNICKNDCFYCGIRKSNSQLSRYRLDGEEIMLCCEQGYRLGFRTFVLQSGEDKFFTPQRLAEIVRRIKAAYPDCAVTLSVGELEFDDYRLLREAGADRYLLRHETADRTHYGRLHPKDMSWDNRMECLENLKSLGYQTGAGIMVGSPFQTAECIARDMLFFERFKPHMIGIGPFIAHKDTPFADMPSGSFELTLFLLSLLRIMNPKTLLPATTALGTIDPKGREKGVLSGANVIMPNLSPLEVRKKYMLYDNKICTGEESAQSVKSLERRMNSIGYEIEYTRGDYPYD